MIEFEYFIDRMHLISTLLIDAAQIWQTQTPSKQEFDRLTAAYMEYNNEMEEKAERLLEKFSQALPHDS